ncbi:hypothetical protein DU002_12495 [Corallincola holothuriorum]|uniref:Replication origin-binding protein domain-containing protein n=1 Tax=Corallincola holothuriorum TaxID=2282215 RepID=A0A368NFB3_9GAMM|nr:hypothetical protein [Corallincola holothuriorum]RCU49168.1 hypothetical protein DU002_12495 [Corallincola holothuriorum]
MLRITTIKSPQARKAYTLKNNQIEADGQPLSKGTAQVINLDSLCELLNYTNQDIAVVHGIPEYDLRCRQKPFNITTLAKENIKTKHIARAKKNFIYNDETIVLLDVDDLINAKYQFTTIERLLDYLYKIYSFLKGKEVLAIPSSSNGLIDIRTKQPLKANSNQKWHIYFRIKKHLIPAFKRYLIDFAWHHKHGYVFVSKSGAIYERCLVDTAVFSPERLDYIGSIDDQTGFLKENKPNAVYRSGNIIDAIPFNPYSAQTQQLFTAQRQTEATKLKVYNNVVTWLTDRVKEGKETLSPEQIHERAKKKSEQDFQYDVLPDTTIIEVDGKELTVGEIAEDLKKYQKKYCADPITDKQCKCIILPASYAKYGFVLKSYVTDSYYFFGEEPEKVSQAEINKILPQLKKYLESINKEFQGICSWRQAALINNEWVNFHVHFNGFTTLIDVIRAKQNTESVEVRVNQNTDDILNPADRYFAYYNGNKESLTKAPPKVLYFGGNAGIAKSYSAQKVTYQTSSAVTYVTNTNKNIDDYKIMFGRPIVQIKSMTNILWDLLVDKYGHQASDKADYDADVKRHFEPPMEFGVSIFESLDHWFDYKHGFLSLKRTRQLSSAKLEQTKSRIKSKCFVEMKWLADCDCQHQILTLAKAKTDFKHFKKRINKQLEEYGSVIVFIDEMDAVKANPQSGFVSVYEHIKGGEDTSFNKPVNADLEQAVLMDYLYNKAGVFVVLLSAERGIDQALNARGVIHIFLDRFQPLFDNDLSVAYVKSTSAQLRNGTSAKLEHIANVKEHWPDYKLTVDGLNENQKQDSIKQGLCLHTHEGLKGHNDKQDDNFASIFTYPHPAQIQRILLSWGIDESNKKDGDEQYAVSILISNCFNQTTGRNTGYRNRSDSKHLAIIPIGLAPLIKSDVVTINHDVKIELVEEPKDTAFVAKLIESKIEAEKQIKNQEIIEGNKSFFRQEFIKPVVDDFNKSNKQQFKANDVAKYLFGDVFSRTKRTIDGKRVDLFCY